MLTGECRVDRVAIAIAEGADSYIAKPISAKILMSHLIKLIAADKSVHYLD
jgi:AmiR/NasT family two-component response regulator